MTADSYSFGNIPTARDAFVRALIYRSTDRPEEQLGGDDDRYASGEYGGSARMRTGDESDSYNITGSDDTLIGSSNDDAIDDVRSDAWGVGSRSYGTTNNSGEPSHVNTGEDDGTYSYDDSSEQTSRPDNVLGSSDDETPFNKEISDLSGETERTSDQSRDNDTSNSNATSTLDSTSNSTTVPSNNAMTDTEPHAPEFRFDSHHKTEPYSGGTEHGSGTTAGVGHGNKTAPDPEDLDHSSTRLDSAHLKDPYTNPTKYGSGTTAGPGAGNKMESVEPFTDSNSGKLMEKVGGMLKKDSLVEKGQAKREAAGYSAN